MDSYVIKSFISAVAVLDEESDLGFFNHMMTFMSLLIVIFTFPLSMLFCIKVRVLFDFDFCKKERGNES